MSLKNIDRKWIDDFMENIPPDPEAGLTFGAEEGTACGFPVLTRF